MMTLPASRLPAAIVWLMADSVSSDDPDPSDNNIITFSEQRSDEQRCLLRI